MTMTTEQLAALRRVAQRTTAGVNEEGCPECDEILTGFRAAFNPTTCLALLEEVERLRTVVDAAVEWRRFGYERKHEFYVGISPLLDAIDVYDVGQRRSSTEYTGDDD